MKTEYHTLQEADPITVEMQGGDGIRPLVLLVCAEQCAASRALEQMTAELATDYARHLQFRRVDASKAVDLMRRYCIHSTPSLVIVHRESVLYHATGELPRRELQTIFDAAARSCGSPVEELGK